MSCEDMKKIDCWLNYLPYKKKHKRQLKGAIVEE